MIEVSVVIPSYNQPNTVRRCVESLLKQRFSGTYEIIIVDSSPICHQALFEEIARLDPRLRLIRRKKQTYPGTARNIGIDAAQGKIIALTDSDCVVAEDWLENICTQMTENTILTGKIENGTPKNLFGTASYLVEFSHFLPSSTQKEQIYAAATCNFACQKAVFEQVGYFSDDRAFEDFLFCEKFRKKGGSILKIQNLAIVHLNKTTLAQVAQNQKMLGRFSAIVRKKHKMPPALVFKFPFLSFALVPFRYFRVFWRVLGKKELLDFLWCTPIVIYLLICWGRGFYQGASQSAVEEM